MYPKPDRKEKAEVVQLLRGYPPYPSQEWSKTQLIDTLVILSLKNKANEFIKKVIELGNTDFKHPSGMYL